MTGGTGPAYGVWTGGAEPAPTAVAGTGAGVGGETVPGASPGSAAVVGRSAVVGPVTPGAGADPLGATGRPGADMVPVSPRNICTNGSSTLPSAKQRLASAQHDRVGSSVPRSRASAPPASRMAA